MNRNIEIASPLIGNWVFASQWEGGDLGYSWWITRVDRPSRTQYQVTYVGIMFFIGIDAFTSLANMWIP